MFGYSGKQAREVWNVWVSGYTMAICMCVCVNISSVFFHMYLIK